jgi:DNA-damage-inducible protein D
MNNNIIPIDQSQSPFDAIRRYRADGSEYWEARELMVMMGYKKWERFENPISQAIENLELNGDIVANHFFPLAVKSSGRDASSYELTRYASYMTALCCDGRKPEVAAAKKYFATKAREAEVIIPVQNDRIRELELMVQLAQAETQAAIAQKNLLDTRKAVTEMGNQTVSALILGATVITDKTPVEKVIDYNSGRTFEGVGIQAIAKKLGFGKNTKACWQWLESIGYGKDSGQWELQLAAIEHHKLSPEGYDEILTKWNSGVRQRFIGE